MDFIIEFFDQPYIEGIYKNINKNQMPKNIIIDSVKREDIHLK